jgi:protein O-GlcNAc transferase
MTSVQQALDSAGQYLVQQALDSAGQYFQRGQWQQAEQLYLQVLEVDPVQIDALHQLALIAIQTGRSDRAAGYFRTVLRLRPGAAAAHNNLGNVLLGQGRLAEATASYQEAVRLQPDFAVAHHNLGNTLRRQRRLAEAVASLRRALVLQPDYAKAHYHLGRALQAQGELAEAVASLHQAVRLSPDDFDAHYALGNALFLEGRSAESAVQFQHALRVKPDSAEAHSNLGTALLDVGRSAEAVASYREAVRLKPDSAEVHYNLGIGLWRQGRLEEAVAHYRRALQLKPDYVEAYHHLGMALMQQEQLAEAAASLQQALRLKPDHADAHMGLGVLYRTEGRLDDAIASYRTGLRLKPDANLMHSNLIFLLLFHPGYDAEAILRECRAWNRQHAEPLRGAIQPHRNRPDPERRLRIGYVSPDFNDHVQSLFTIPLLSNHDHRQCEVFCYADVWRPDHLTERLRGDADAWRSTVGLSDQQVADLVRGDQVDILVDLTMHMANNRLLAFARKPAPIQVAWLAYPGTTGLAAMDYRLTDPYLDPPGLSDACYSEESVRLPETFWCYDPLGDQPPVNALPALENGFVTFGCLNNFSKVNDGCLALWARVMRAAPRSRLVLLAPPGRPRDHVLARLGREGIEAPRVEFVGRRPRPEYLGLYQRIDMALDPVHCNGHTTSLDGFWMGVPTVTLVGQTVVGRAGWSQLSNLGLRELAAETPEGYVAVATRLAGDLSRLRELRGGLRERMRGSPLMDAGRFARQMEQAYREMWHRWCRHRRGDEPA